jgi:carbon monoxide dehydrogenase subunit G
MGKTTTFKRGIEINAPKDQVWKALADFGNICHAHPAVDTSHVTSQKKDGLGATRHCNFNMMGATAEERAIEWNEGRNIKIEAYELKKLPGIKTIVVDFAVEARGEKTWLTSTMEYSMKNPFFDMMNTLMMKKMNSQLIDGIAAGHKKYIETGEIVRKDTKLELDKVIRIQ